MSRKQRLITGFLLRPLLYGLYYISGFFHRDSQTWVFGTWGGERFSDNSAALFRYCCALEDKPIRAVWISPRKSVRQLATLEGLEAHHPWSLQGIAVCLKAGIYIFDVNSKDINHWLSRGAKSVLLRHGTGIKKIARATDNQSRRLYRLYYGHWLQRAILRFYLPWHAAKLDLVMATSEQHAEQAQLFYGVQRSQVEITGFPRNDVLFSNTPTRNDDASVWIDESHQQGKQVFVYMPTFRDDNKPAYPYSWEALDELAGRLSIRVLARLHPVDTAIPSQQQSSQFKNIKLHDQNSDLYQLFHKIDCLITDYSSVVYDFMLLRRPIIFFCPDLEDFLRNNRSFCFNYQDVTPAPKVKTLMELESIMKKIICNDAELAQWRTPYEQVLLRFHYYQDGQSSARCHTAILERLA